MDIQFYKQDLTFYSHELQDEFITNLFGLDYSGTFLDICCCHPVQGSNTYTLEKEFKWNGYCFDLLDVQELWQWDSYRTSQFFQCDVSSEKFVDYLKEIKKTNPLIDYASIDVDSNLTLLALQRIQELDFELKAVTYEHEYYIHNDLYKHQSESILEGMGLIKLFENVKLVAANHTSHAKTNDTESFEDWWINPKYFPKEILELKSNSLYYHHCVKKLKEYAKLDYKATHACSRAFPDEYNMFVIPGERENMKNILEFIRSKNLNA